MKKKVVYSKYNPAWESVWHYGKWQEFCRLGFSSVFTLGRGFVLRGIRKVLSMIYSSRMGFLVRGCLFRASVFVREFASMICGTESVSSSPLFTTTPPCKGLIEYRGGRYLISR